MWRTCQLRTTPIARWQHSKTKAITIRKQYFLNITFLTSKSSDHFTEKVFIREKDPMLTLTRSAVQPYRLKNIQFLPKGEYFSKQKMICKIKYLLQSHFLQTTKLSDALYKFWRLAILRQPQPCLNWIKYFVVIIAVWCKHGFQPGSCFSHYVF